MKPKTPSQKKAYDALNTRLAKYMAQVQGIYDDICLRLANAVSLTDYDGVVEFLFKNYPELASLIGQLMADYAAQMNSLIYSGTSEEWKQSNLLQDLLVEKAMKVYGFDKGGDKYNRYFQTDNAALKAFQQRKDRGLNLSQKLWLQSEELKKELECALSVAIERGTSAVTLSKRLSQYLVDFPNMKADYTDKFGHAASCRDCEYASMRLARSEINMAYRTAEHLRWQQFDFILGFDVKLSGRHPAPDICDDLKGRYPKDFKFTGWHPNCYSCDSEVLTNAGWKRFYDVADNDLILSLNPESLQPEWVVVKARQSYHYKGEMIHFFNKSLDCLVTPDHQMVYLNKGDGRIKKCSASLYTKGKGAFYRGCEYCADDVDTFTIGDKSIPFDLFCEFMGYWLSDGSTQSNSGVVISQQKGEPAFEKILSCIRHFGFSPRVVQSNVVFYNTSMRNYLKRFGTCACKYIPDEIKNASKRQILIFLDAFSICDGHRRPSKTFVGSHGNVFKSGNDEISYFTTSKRMASDLSELMLKVGHRPSLSVKGPVTTRKRDGSYIRGNYECITIRECYSLTSTVFGKSAIPYDGTVYDLTLERNHIMYVMRNGKCFWGSNCMCYTVPVVMTDDEYMADDATKKVKDVPDGFKRWIDNNIHRAKSWESTPYFIRDNSKYIREDFKVNVYNKTEKSFARKRRTNLAMSRVEYYNKVYPDIPEVQLAAVNAYTQAVVKCNNGATSREINRRLRNGTADEYVTAASTLISSALQKLPGYTGVTYRGETMTMKKLQERILSHVGETISDKGFFSTSRYTDTPMKFITHDGVPKSHKRVIFEIQGKNGRDISKISEFNGIFTTENQHEVLFDKGAKFFVRPDYKIDEDGYYRIKLIEQ